MPSINSLINRLKTDYPQFTFQESSEFLWDHDSNTIYFEDKSNCEGFLLHELSHALLLHTDYERDVQLIAMESKAWDTAQKLADKYHVELSDDFIQSNLDTYRDWLHKRSTCPECQSTGLQTKSNTFRCLACNNQWTVNDAKTCALKRYKIKK
ncbi:hypothetical protein HGB25_01120 [Candidatus Saccharibacteria bacterium]|nr:hypothetical protein [Candidatus Saccharibacteria bacterium]